MIIGLTGGSGTGKTTVCQWFAKKGYCIIDGDQLSRQITAKGSETLKQIIQVFGAQFLTEDGNLNRRKLGLHVFSNAQALKELNRITHTAITQEVKRILAQTDKAVIEGAAIHECEVWTLCDCCIFVSCPKEKQIERIMQRDHLTREYAEKRISAQKSDAYYRQKCDYEIVNDGEKSIEEQLEGLHFD